MAALDYLTDEEKRQHEAVRLAGATGKLYPAQEQPAETVPPPRILQFIRPAAWEGQPIPPRRWLVPEFIPFGEITMLSGDGGTGKSLLALQLAVATATAKEWIGTAPEPGKVLFISAEDSADELHRRTANICRAMGIRFADLNDLRLLSLAGDDAILAAPEKRADGALRETPLFTAIEAAAREFKPSLLVLDTLADLFGGNEILRPHARQFIGLLRRLALNGGPTILLLSHPSQSGMTSGAGTSGSTAWSNSVRSRLYLERAKSSDDERDDDCRVLTTKKANYGRAGAERVLRWKDGVFIAEGMGGGAEAQRRADAERVFLALLSEFERQGRHVSPAKSPSFAPAVFSRHEKAKGFSAKLLNDAMERLLSANRIHLKTSGPPSKSRQHIAAGPGPITYAERRDEN